MEGGAPERPAPPRKGGLPRSVKVFLVLLLLGTAVSTWVFVDRIYPIQQQLALLKEEALAFRARDRASIASEADASVPWDDLLSGAAREKVVRVRGLVGLKYQIIEGAAGGTLFLFPPDSPSLDTGPRALLYFVEDAPPAPGSLVEADAWVSQMDVRASVSVISPEQLGVLEESIPGAVLIAAAPLKVVAPPRPELLPGGASGEAGSPR